MKRASIALALSAALLAFSSPRTAPPEPGWVTFSCGRGEGACAAVDYHPLIEVVAQGATPWVTVPLDEQTTIVLDEGTLVVTRQGREIWRSDPTWDVRQLLVADVNNDGQEEVAFVLWRPFRLEPAIVYETFGFPALWEQDSVRNHLFIYAWRDGVWQRLWCSSPVAEPIIELGAADVDGEGSNELVVLEGTYDAPDAPPRRVSVWRWNGWGFTLLWRSPGGAWDHLLLRDVTDDGVLDILVREPT
jgi:hypothetical protein